MNTIPHIQADPGWSVVTGQSIGPAVPKIVITPKPPPQPVGSLLLGITGVKGKYADGVARSVDYPLPANAGNLALAVTFSVDPASLEFTQAIEIGCKPTLPDGTTLNGQLQFDYGKSATEMTLDLTSVKGSDWAPTTLTLPKFAPNVRHTVSIAYKLDVPGKKISVMTVLVDGTLFETPAAMQGVPGKALGWAKDRVMVNCQANTNPKGGTWQWEIYDAELSGW